MSVLAAWLLIAAAAGATPSASAPADFTALVRKAERALADRRMPEVIALYEEAAAIAMASSRPGDHAFALARHCGALWYFERPREARPMCEQALRLAQEVGASHAASEAERFQGILDGDLGRYESAEARLHRAVEHAEAAGAAGSLSAAWVSLSVAARTQGRYADSANYARRALEAQEGATDLPAGARFPPRFNLGKALEGEGDEEGARHWLDESFRIAQAEGLRGPLHHVLFDTALILLRAGDLPGAESYFERTVQWNVAGGFLGDAALGRSGLAAVLEIRHQPERALALYREALDTFETLDVRRYVPQALLGIARSLSALGHFEEALETARRAEREARSMRLRTAEIQAFLEQLHIGVARGDRDDGDVLEKGARRALGSGLRTDGIRALVASSRLAESSGHHTRALGLIEEAIGEIERLRARLAPELKWRFAETAHRAYASLYRLRMTEWIGARGGPGEAAAARAAFEAIERERSRDLEEAGPSRGRSPSAQDTDRLAKIQAELEGELTSARRAALLHDRDDIERDLMLRSAGAFLPQFARAGAIAVEAETLGQGEALVTYVLADPPAAFIVSGSAVIVAPLGRIDSLASQARLFADLHATGRGDEATVIGRSLSLSLVAPVLARLPPGTSRLLLAPTGELAQVPFGALPHPTRAARYLLDGFEISYTPSLRFTAALRARGPARAVGALVLADPVTEPTSGTGTSRDGLGRLPNARIEGHEVAAFFTEGRLLQGAEAKRAALAEHGAGAGVLHFATHAVVDRFSPMRSALLLSAPGPSKNDWLTARDIHGLSIDASLVTLSACHSSVGPILRSEAVPSIARAFLYAGSRAVVASLWKVDDRATLELMRGFYGELARGQNVGSALRSAQLTLAGSRRFSDSKHWAGFVVVGDPDSKVGGLAPKRPPSGIALISTLAGALGLLGFWRFRGRGRRKEL